MKIGLIGLGKMGSKMARRLLKAGHVVVGFNRSPEVTRELEAEANLVAVFSPEEMIQKLDTPRIIWTMLPAGAVTETMQNQLLELMDRGDILIDGGNANYKDSIRRAQAIESQGVHAVDVGVSGGIWGLAEGYSLMAGGDEDIIEYISPILKTLAPAPDAGWGRVGTHGAGHFVKMVHNGIEYGMMEALAEGFEIMHSKKELGVDVHQVSQIWQQGSVVRSWLLDLAERALRDDPALSTIEDWVADSGEGRWTVQEAIDLDVPAPVITLSLFQRFESRQTESYAGKILAALRNQFGGHAIRKVGE